MVTLQKEMIDDFSRLVYTTQGRVKQYVSSLHQIRDDGSSVQAAQQLTEMSVPL